MKIIKSYMIVTFILGTIYLFMQFAGNAMKVENELVVPIEEWGEILIGNWKIEMTNSKLDETQYFEGEIEYSPNGSFKRVMSYYHYLDENHRTVASLGRDNSYLIASGSIGLQGSYQVLDGYRWKEIVDTCVVSEVFSLREEGFYDVICIEKGNSVTVGYKDELLHKLNVDEFNKEKIIITGRNYDSNFDVRMEFTKKS